MLWKSKKKKQENPIVYHSPHPVRMGRKKGVMSYNLPEELQTTFQVVGTFTLVGQNLNHF